MQEYLELKVRFNPDIGEVDTVVAHDIKKVIARSCLEDRFAKFSEIPIALLHKTTANQGLNDDKIDITIKSTESVVNDRVVIKLASIKPITPVMPNSYTHTKRKIAGKNTQDTYSFALKL